MVLAHGRTLVVALTIAISSGSGRRRGCPPPRAGVCSTRRLQPGLAITLCEKVVEVFELRPERRRPLQLEESMISVYGKTRVQVVGNNCPSRSSSSSCSHRHPCLHRPPSSQPAGHQSGRPACRGAHRPGSVVRCTRSRIGRLDEQQQQCRRRRRGTPTRATRHTDGQSVQPSYSCSEANRRLRHAEPHTGGRQASTRVWIRWRHGAKLSGSTFKKRRRTSRRAAVPSPSA